MQRAVKDGTALSQRLAAKAFEKKYFSYKKGEKINGSSILSACNFFAVNQYSDKIFL